MKRIFVTTRSGSDWQRLLAKPQLHWKPGRSAMTAAASWEGADGRLPSEISDLLDSCGAREVADLQLLVAIPEWQVALPGGSRPSCTDVLALARNDRGLCVMAVEAKAGEDFGPTLGSRRAEPSDGQAERIGALEQLLDATFGAEIRYQLLHRTASALLTAADFHASTAVMLVHVWNAAPEQRADLERFCTALKADALAPGVWRTRRAGRTLFMAWCDGDPRHARAILPPDDEALRAG